MSTDRVCLDERKKSSKFDSEKIKSIEAKKIEEEKKA